MRTKFKTHVSDALKFSFLETPIDNIELDQNELLTEEEKLIHLE